MAVFRQLCYRIKDHALQHQLNCVDLALHGGEPLLRKPEFFAQAITTAKEIFSDCCEVNIGVQTNATLLTDEHLELFLQHGIRIGVSLDGTAEINDKYRIYKNGKGSYNQAITGINKLNSPRFKPIFAGILTVIDVTAPPLEIFRHLESFQPPTLDFLEHDGHWQRLPNGKSSASSTEYADWLIAIFDQWFAASQQIRIRRFEEIIEHLLGGHGEMEYFGLEPVTLLVVATDGSYESVDVIKSVKDGIEYTGLNVFDHPIDDVFDVGLIKLRQLGMEALSQQCHQCEFVHSCGGGYFPHRYSETAGFKNPSIYCADYIKLFGHIREKLFEELGIEFKTQKAA
jgi:uncharacterized protein